MPKEERFIADAMLGNLAKWLRILGFDTLYFRTIDDNEIIRIAKQKQRILLTRDTCLVKRKTIDNCILINSNEVSGQLKEVLLWVKGQGSKVKGNPRCAKCNGELVSADSESVADDVPEHVFLNFNSFFRCKNCGKVYWEGSHRKLIDEKIQNILGEINAHWKSSEKD
ncbi:MAG: Mut7-C RNAse domain-containing protein [Nitrospirae bacterium]|nr:Mut7-C RNAse domain-containing protein [Nitrospirota bacterium]MDA8214933.1 Mut7-C RNAse domain-containing protein [Nitrospiraceae bacterium]